MAGHRRVKEVMHLAVVACGNRLDETLAMVKSALLFSLKRITFHIFAEDSLAPQFDEKVRTLPVAPGAQISTVSGFYKKILNVASRRLFFCYKRHTFWFVFYVHFFSECSDFSYNPAPPPPLSL